VIRTAIQTKIVPMNLFSPCRTWSVELVVDSVKSVIEPVIEPVRFEVKVEIIPVSKVSIIQESITIEELI
jgi:hypothetical protein